MKILYIGTNVNNPPNEPLVDYQNDCLLIGLKEHFGDDVVDVQKRHHIYKDFPVDEALKQYGKGFTVTRVIESDNADRTDIEKKIKTKFFDLVIYGSIWRNSDHLDLVLEHYPKNQVIMVDGEDTTKFHNLIKMETLYLKREIQWEDNREFEKYFGNVAPISFAFPTQKINAPLPKTQKDAINDPRKPNSYIFNDETSYYEDYRKSKFAFTMRKAGWDCLRHYEIMGNGCIPLFDQMAACPRFIMTRFPKALLSKIAFFHKNDYKYLEQNYDYFLSELTDHFMKYNTTDALVKYLMKDLSRYKVYKGQQ